MKLNLYFVNKNRNCIYIINVNELTLVNSFRNDEILFKDNESYMPEHLEIK